MPIILKKIYSITGNYTQAELEVLQGYIDEFRLRMADDDPEKNILIGKILAYSDNKVIQFLKASVKDINGGVPSTSYTLFTIGAADGDDLVVKGAMVMALISQGILQLRNQIDYNDSGLSIAMFNKTGLYQGWAGFILQDYLKDKKEFKDTVITKSDNSGFIGIMSEFGYTHWN